MPTRHIGPKVALAGVLAANAVILTGAPASAARLTVPAGATLAIAGHGYGHGHGMSQYGAEGAARQGLSARQILAFYYPGTRGGQVSTSVRVLITASIGGPTKVVARPGLQVRDLTRGTLSAVPARGPASKASLWKMSGASGGRTQVSYRTDAWHVWRTLAGNGEFRSSGAPLTLVLPQGRVTYRGTLRSMAAISSTTHRITVNKVPLEAYVKGVVAREMPSTWHAAALRTQAVAARTYAAYEVGDSYDPRFNLCDSTSCQVYGGLSAETASTNAATEATAGQVRVYQGAPAFTQFSSSNGGWSADGGQPYLPAQQDPYDGWPGNHHHSWSVQVASAKVAKAYGLGTLQSISIIDRDGNGEWGGRVLHLQLVGSKKTVTVTGASFQGALGLQSTWFDVTVAG